MDPNPIIEIHRDGHWLPAARIEPLGDEHARVEYLPEYVFGQNNPWPVSLTWPVGLSANLDQDARPQMPAFLYDLVPQGPGRKLLAGLLGLRDHENLALPLALNGAFNPIGAIRIDQAVAFHADYLERNPAPPDSTAGFRLTDLSNHSESVAEMLSIHAMLASGTTGVQGAAPKFLLTADRDGRLHPDLALPEARAHSHWLVKGPRGRNPDDETILRNEAAYLRLAALCGVEVHAVDDIEHHGRWLKIRRFDRVVTEQGVVRLMQESLASLASLQGFGMPTTLNRLLEVLRQHSDEPAADTLEFLRRDILNQAMRNTDNHARNHAVQRRMNGTIRLTPLFDFAPMFRDPELIPRALHWVDQTRRRLHDWPAILDQLLLDDQEVEHIRIELRQFADTVGQLPELAVTAGVDPEIIEACRDTIDHQAESLARLR